MLNLSLKGDIRACKLFLESAQQKTPSTVGTYIDKQQNNYVTNLLTPEVVENLTPEQIAEIEEVIRGA
ncbi:MAG: hypothetical protein QNK23_02080 [Crocinitomicaceae bacterium]|nr:hypothetical protein [Crocinitomicaceae bacterium]